MAAVLLIVTNWDKLGDTGNKTGWYLPEVAHPYYVFKDAGLSITICSPNGGAAPMVCIVLMPKSYSHEVLCMSI